MIHTLKSTILSVLYTNKIYTLHTYIIYRTYESILLSQSINICVLIEKYRDKQICLRSMCT